jgi:AcrR family transcriptional regulator
MRADAVRNREKLLSALLELGPDASLEAVARRAGVGIGTLYRHFPTREALIEATYRHEVDRLCAVDELLAEHPPDEALGIFIDRFVDYSQTKRGMAGALDTITAAGSNVRSETSAQIRGSVAELLAAAVRAGTVRDDVDAQDVLGAMRGVWQAEDADRARRIARLIIAGLRP